MPEQESRNQQVGIAVTASEKAAIRILAQARRTEISTLLREMPFAEAVERGRVLLDTLDKMSRDDENKAA